MVFAFSVSSVVCPSENRGQGGDLEPAEQVESVCDSGTDSVSRVTICLLREK